MFVTSWTISHRESLWTQRSRYRVVVSAFVRGTSVLTHGAIRLSRTLSHFSAISNVARWLVSELSRLLEFSRHVCRISGAVILFEGLLTTIFFLEGLGFRSYLSRDCRFSSSPRTLDLDSTMLFLVWQLFPNFRHFCSLRFFQRGVFLWKTRIIYNSITL